MTTETTVEAAEGTKDTSEKPCPICGRMVTTREYARKVHKIACARRNNVEIPVEETADDKLKTDMGAVVIGGVVEEPTGKEMTPVEAQTAYAKARETEILADLQKRVNAPDGGLVAWQADDPHQKLENEMRSLGFVKPDESVYLGTKEELQGLLTQGYHPVTDKAGFQFADATGVLFAFARKAVISRAVAVAQSQESRDRLASAYKQARARVGKSES